MKKLLKILLVKKLETENKWWDRFFNVFLGGTAIIVLLSVFLLTIESHKHNWVTYDPVVFSLEQTYKQVDGKELPCKEDLDWDNAKANEELKTIIQCDGVTITYSQAKRYGALYNLADEKLRQIDGIKELDDKFIQICKDEISSQTFPTIYSGTLTPEQIAELKCVVSKEKADSSYNQLYDKYQNDLKGLASIKVVRNVHIGIIIGDIALLLLIPILSALIWVLFWSLIIYRLILYIIFGNKK
jgi:hypothetical protein